jgi:hypothetical protein
MYEFPTLMKTLLAGTLCILTACAASRTRDPQVMAGASRVALTGVTGAWLVDPADVDALVADGTRWSGTTDTSSLAQISKKLFGVSNGSFIRNGAATGAFPIAVATNVAQFGDGTLRVQFALRGGASDQNAGIVFDLQPTGEYHYLRYNTKDGDLALWKFSDGARSLIAHGTAHAQLALNTWHTLEVSVRGVTISARIATDSTLRFTHALTSAVAGRVGVWVKRDAVTAFRWFEVRADQMP